MAIHLSSFFVVLLGWYAWIESNTRTALRACYRFTAYLLDYFHNDETQWRIYTDHAIPVSYHRKKRTFGPLTPHWLYDPIKNQMTSSDPTTNTSVKPYRIGWLSAEIELETTDHETRVMSMDSFLESFTLYRSSTAPYPLLSELFMAWCIYHGQWYGNIVWLRIRVIDEHASEHDYRIRHSSHYFQPIQGHTLHLTSSPVVSFDKKIDDDHKPT